MGSAKGTEPDREVKIMMQKVVQVSQYELLLLARDLFSALQRSIVYERQAVNKNFDSSKIFGHNKSIYY